MSSVTDEKDSRPGAIDLLGVLFVLILMLRPVGFAGDPGVGWHLMAGNWMVEHQAFLSYDPFLFSAEGAPWINNQWLSDILFSFVFSLGGWPLLDIVVLCVSVAVPILLLQPLMRELKLNEVAILLAVALASFEMAIQWFLRPVIFSFLLFAVVLGLVYRWHDDKDRNLWMLPPLFLLWVNLHPGVATGFLLLGVSILALLSRRHPDLGRLKHLVCVIAACGCVSLVNPYGFRLFSNAVSLADSRYFMNLNQEWFSPIINDLLFLPFFAVIFLFFLATATRSSDRSSGVYIHAFDILLVAIFVFFALLSRRMIPFFAIASAVPLGKVIHLWIRKLPMTSSLRRGLERVSLRYRNRTHSVYTLGAVGVFALLAFAGVSGRNSSPAPFYSEKIAQAIRDMPRTDATPLRLFSTPNWGGYLTLTNWPQAQAFIDDRNELNGVARYEEFRTIVLALPGWEELLEKYKIDMLILNQADPVTTLLDEKSSAGKRWDRVLEDQRFILYRRVG